MEIRYWTTIRGGALLIWDIEKCEIIQDLQASSNPSVTFTSDQKTVANVLYGRIKVCDVQQGLEIASLEETSRKCKIYFDDCGDRLLVISSERSNILVWDVKAGVATHSLCSKSKSSFHSACFDPVNKNQVVAANVSASQLEIWSVEPESSPLLVSTRFVEELTSFAFSPDNCRIGLIGRDVAVLDLRTNEIVKLLQDCVTMFGIATHICFNCAGDRAVVNSQGKRLKIFDVGTGVEIQSLSILDDNLAGFEYVGFNDCLALAWTGCCSDGIERIICSFETGWYVFNAITGECMFRDKSSPGCNVHVARGGSVILM